MRQHPPKSLLTFNGLHGVISHNRQKKKGNVVPVRN
jgi:hypothetical protein